MWQCLPTPLTLWLFSRKFQREFRKKLQQDFHGFARLPSQHVTAFSLSL